MNTKKFACELMGKLVDVCAEMRRVTDLSRTGPVAKRWVAHKIQPRTGWVVGTRVIYDGTIDPGSYEEPTAFSPNAQQRVLLVAYWPTMRPVRVRESDARPATGNPKPPTMSDRDRCELSRYMREEPQPRGKGGRFVGAKL